MTIIGAAFRIAFNLFHLGYKVNVFAYCPLSDTLEVNPPRRDESIWSLGDHFVEGTHQDPRTTDLSESIQPPQSPPSASPISFNVEIGEEAEEDHTIEGQFIMPIKMKNSFVLWSSLFSLLWHIDNQNN